MQCSSLINSDQRAESLANSRRGGRGKIERARSAAFSDNASPFLSFPRGGEDIVRARVTRIYPRCHYFGMVVRHIVRGRLIAIFRAADPSRCAASQNNAAFCDCENKLGAYTVSSGLTHMSK